MLYISDWRYVTLRYVTLPMEPERSSANRFSAHLLVFLHRISSQRAPSLSVLVECSRRGFASVMGERLLL